jgi:HlyD family secretion protein
MAHHMTRLLAGILLLAVVSGVGWYLLQEPDAEQLPSYSRGQVSRGDISAVVSATGTLNPINTVQVGSQVSGTIQHLYADFNDRVQQGQVIAQIDPAIFKAKRAEAAANLKSAEAARDKAWVGVQDAKREYDRQADLFKRKLVAESVLDAAKFAYQSASVEHQVKQASVAQARAALEREQVNLDYTTIYAPVDGVVISRDVDESFIGQVQRGQPVSFTVFAYPRRHFSGSVAQVRLQPKVEAGVVKYNCIIHVDNADLALKPGMTATVSIEVARREQVLTVPNAALRYVPDLPEEELDRAREGLKPGQAVLWRDDGDHLTPLTVDTGIIGENATEVSGPDITDGLAIAVPLKRQDAERRRRFSLSLF